jgi:hypothetical protein
VPVRMDVRAGAGSQGRLKMRTDEQLRASRQAFTEFFDRAHRRFVITGAIALAAVHAREFWSPSAALARKRDGLRISVNWRR